jgi:O-antigen ligase
MTALSSYRRVSRPITAYSRAVPLLQVFAVTVMVFPADEVIKAIGAGGYPAALVAYCLFLAWVAATLLGLHKPLDYRYPVRLLLCALWIVSLASYALMDRATLSIAEQAAADRWLMQLAAVSGVILVVAEGLRSVRDVQRFLRALTWGGAFCGIVAGLQFWLKLDITASLRTLPGFSVNQADVANTVISSRGGINRVPGTATDPIELGVVAAMLLPLAVCQAMHDVERSKGMRWFPVICIAIAIPASVSRSAFLAAAVALGMLIVSLSPTRRLLGLAAVLLGVASIYVAAPKLISTLVSSLLAGTGDPSIAHRLATYPLAERLVQQAPWLGQGGGTYIAQNQTQIFDNQYLTTAVELGLVGVVVLTSFLLWPAIAALVARGRTADPRLRDLCAALAGAALAATICSGTFDSLSFPMFVNVQAIVLGLIGAVWLLVDQEMKAVSGTRILDRTALTINETSTEQSAGSGSRRLGGGN